VKLLQTERVQIRVSQLEADTYNVAKGKTKSVTIYDTTLEEVWQVVDEAIKKKCNEGQR